ncbi:hypothetical protein [Paraburkholderia youngii]|uniref:hypothetical protein n=1 Tax=Paraburkholderia youngii TaxID=2782701 RepID=UPI0015916C81|nr:hypothetical protein [Paraburkholderia youngii]NUX58067.1 hypothetical protein [Paraburkholderia youngii]
MIIPALMVEVDSPDKKHEIDFSLFYARICTALLSPSECLPRAISATVCGPCSWTAIPWARGAYTELRALRRYEWCNWVCSRLGRRARETHNAHRPNAANIASATYPRPLLQASLKRRAFLRHRKKIESEEARFKDYWQSFQELRKEKIEPTGNKVAARLAKRTGKRNHIFEFSKFHTVALRLADVSSVDLDEDTRCGVQQLMSLFSNQFLSF